MPLLEYDMSAKWSDYAVAWAEKWKLFACRDLFKLWRFLIYIWNFITVLPEKLATEEYPKIARQ